MLKNKQIYGFRKLKTCLAGVAIATALVGVSVVNADEAVVTTKESIVRSVDNGDGTKTWTEPYKVSDSDAIPPGPYKAIEPILQDKSEPMKPSESYTGAVVEPKTDGLNKSIDNASQAGLEVKQGDTKQVANADEAKNDYTNQAKSIDKTVADYKQSLVDNKSGQEQLSNAVNRATDAGLKVKADTKTVKSMSDTDYQKQAQAIDKAVADYKQSLVDNKSGQEQLSNVVNRAMDAGLKVKVDTKTVKSMSDTDYQKQAQVIDKAVADYKQSLVDNKSGQEQLSNAVNRATDVGLKVKADTKTVKSMSDTDYQKQAQAIDKAVADYKQAVEQASMLNSQVNKLIEEAKKYGFTFDVKTKTLTASSQVEADAKGKEIQVKLKKYIADLAAYEAKLKALNDVTFKKDGNISVTGKLNTDKQGFEYYKDLKVVYTGADKTVTLVNNLGWTSKTDVTSVTGMTLSKFNNGTTKSNTVNGTRITSTVTGKYILSNLKDGATFKLKNVGSYQNGKTIDMLITINFDSVHKGKTDKNMPFLILGHDLGDTYKPISFEMMNMHHVKVSFTYLDASGKKVKVLDARIISDVDYGQTSNIKFNSQSGFINPKGSQLIDDKNGLIHIDENLGTFGLASAPAGTYVYYGIGDTIVYDHYSNKVGSGYRTVGSNAYVEFSLFGTAGQISQQLFVKPSPLKIDAVKYTVDKPMVNVTNYILEKPTLKATTYLLEKPVVKATGYNIQKPVVNYHLNYFEVQSKPVKDVVVSGKSVDGKTIKIGKNFQYLLQGVQILGTRQNKLITQYDFLDMLDVKHDEYKGMYHVLAKGIIKLKDGTIIKDKDDLLKYAKAYWDKKTGKVQISLNSDFLSQIADDSDFQAIALLDVKRINSGTVYNQFINVVNGQEVVSNTVKTVTPEVPKPTPPAPEIPAPKASIQKAGLLPHTGDKQSVLGLFGVSMLAVLSLGMFVKRKQEN